MHRLYDARLAQARAGSLSRRVGQRFSSLDAVAEALKIARATKVDEVRLLELRNAAIACLALPDLRIAQEWAGWPPDTFSADFDCTLERYARVDRQGVVHIHRVAAKDEVFRLQGMGPGQAWPRFSPNGQFLALAYEDRGLKVWKLAGTEAVVVIADSGGRGGPDFSPDGRLLAFRHADGSIRVYELPSGHLQKQLGGIPSPRYVVFHPDARQLAVSCDTGVRVFEVATWKILADLPEPAGADCIAWHPDGKTLAVGGRERVIHIWDVAARKIIAKLEGHKSDGIGFGYNHAGDLLVSTCWDGTMRLWDPQMGQQVFNTRAWVQSLRFSPDDRFLAAESGETNLRIWEVARPSAYRTLVRDPVHGRGLPYNSCAISPDGRLLALTQEAGVSFWDLPGARKLDLPGLDSCTRWCLTLPMPC